MERSVLSPPASPPPPVTQPKHVRAHNGSECAVARGQEVPPKANNQIPRPCANAPPSVPREGPPFSLYGTPTPGRGGWDVMGDGRVSNTCQARGQTDDMPRWPVSQAALHWTRSHANHHRPSPIRAQ